MRITVLVLLLQTQFAWADTGPMRISQSGFAINPQDSIVDVAMDSEHVVLDVYPTLLIVHCTFWLQAGEHAYDNLKVGFPSSTDFSQKAALPLWDFKVWVDGKEAEFTLTDDTDKWNTFNLSFAAHERREIRISYLQGTYWYSPDSVTIQGAYIFQSGREWKGPIKEVALEVRIHEVSPEHFSGGFYEKKGVSYIGRYGKSSYIKSYPSNKITAPDVILENYRKWSIKNWEPDEDFEFSISLSGKEAKAIIYAVGNDSLTSVAGLLRNIGRVNAQEGSWLRADTVSIDQCRSVIRWLIQSARQDTNAALREFAHEELENIRKNLLLSFAYFKRESERTSDLSVMDQIRLANRKGSSPRDTSKLPWAYPEEFFLPCLQWLNPDKKTTEEEVMMDSLMQGDGTIYFQRNIPEAPRTFFRIQRWTMLNIAHERYLEEIAEREVRLHQIRIGAGILTFLTTMLVSFWWIRRRRKSK